MASQGREGVFAFFYIMSHMAIISMTPGHHIKFRAVLRENPQILTTFNKWNNYLQIITGWVVIVLYLLLSCGLIVLGCHVQRMRRRNREHELQEIELAQDQILNLCEDFETVNFKELDKQEQARLRVCPICLMETDIVYKRLPCGHIMHSKCVLEWFIQERQNQRQLICPYCRTPVELQ